jgi:hypothetical protein
MAGVPRLGFSRTLRQPSACLSEVSDCPARGGLIFIPPQLNGLAAVPQEIVYFDGTLGALLLCGGLAAATEPKDLARL